MRRTLRSLLIPAMTIFPVLPAAAATERGFGLEVLVDGSRRPEYSGCGTVYVEALRGREYTLRISNPFPYRVAVALAVDGLNTIDAKHTTAASASKWILDPYETVEIPGWQVSGSTARSFFFTNEESSYGAALGKTRDLGNIEAVFFREKAPKVTVRPWREGSMDQRRDGPLQMPRGAGEPSVEGSVEGGVESEALGRDAVDQPRAKEQSAQRAPSAAPRSEAYRPEPAPKDEYAATGMGRGRDHDVVHVAFDLDPRPAASIRLRYEFRPQLVKLGVLPREPRREEPLARRERSRGFERGWCPMPDAN